MRMLIIKCDRHYVPFEYASRNCNQDSFTGASPRNHANHSIRPSVCAILTQIRVLLNPRMVNARRSRPADSKFAFKIIASRRQNEKGGFSRLDERRRARQKRIARFGDVRKRKDRTWCPPVLSMHRQKRKETTIIFGTLNSYIIQYTSPMRRLKHRMQAKWFSICIFNMHL